MGIGKKFVSNSRNKKPLADFEPQGDFLLNTKNWQDYGGKQF
jgi:hypothetical protein